MKPERFKFGFNQAVYGLGAAFLGAATCGIGGLALGAFMGLRCDDIIKGTWIDFSSKSSPATPPTP